MGCIPGLVRRADTRKDWQGMGSGRSGLVISHFLARENGFLGLNQPKTSQKQAEIGGSVYRLVNRNNL
jgi:hypothetical protein